MARGHALGFNQRFGLAARASVGSVGLAESNATRKAVL